MMTVRKEQNPGIHPGSYEQSNDIEDDDDDDEDGHFIISLEDNGEEEGLLCDPEDISFSSADKQTDASSDVNKAMREEPTTTSRLTYPSVIGAHVQSKRDDPEHLIYTFPTSTVLKNQIDMKNSETEKYSRSQLSSTWVEPESSSIPASSSNNNGCGPRDSMQLVNPMALVSCLPSYQAWEPDKTNKSLQINDDESNKSKSNFDSNSRGLNSQSVPICNQNGPTTTKSLLSTNVSSCEMGLETITLGVESGGIWSEAIFLSKSHNGPHGPYPFCYSNKNTSVAGPSITNTNIQSICSSGHTIPTSSLTISSPPALSALKPSDSLSFSSSTLSSQLASCAPRLSGPYLRTDLIEGTSSVPLGTGGVTESSLPTPHTNDIKHEESVDSAGCSCIMCYKTCGPSAPDTINLDLENGVVGVKIGTNNKRKRALDNQRARKRKEGTKFVDIYILPEETKAINVNGSDGCDGQSKILGSKPSNFLPSPMNNPCINSASPPALPLNTVTSTSSLVHTRTLPSSQGTPHGMSHASASSHSSLNAQKQSQEKLFIGLETVNRPIAPKVLVSLSEVQGKDETSCTADPLCSVTTQNMGSCIISNKSVSPKEKTFATSSLAFLRSQNIKYLQNEPEPSSLKKLEGKCVTSTTQQLSPLYAHQPGAELSSNTSVKKVNPSVVSDTEKSKGSYSVERPAVIVLKDPSQFKILNDILKQNNSRIIGNNSALSQESKAQKTLVSNNNIKSPQITLLNEAPKESIYGKSLLSPNVSTSIISKNFTMHYHTVSSNTTSLLQSSGPSASVSASIPHATQSQCAFISSFQRQSGIGNKNLVYSLLKDNFQTPGQTKNSQMVSASNKLAPEKETSHLGHNLRIVKAEDSGTPSCEDESFGSSCNTPHPPQERLPKSYIEDWVNQAKTYTLNEESITLGSGSDWSKSKPVDEDVTSIHKYTKTTSSPELQSNLTAEVNADAGTRTTLVLPMVPKLKQTPQTPTSLVLTLTPRNNSEEVSASHSFPSAGAMKPDKLYSVVKRTDANSLLSSSASKECLQESYNLSPTKLSKPMGVNRCLTGGRSTLLSQSRKRSNVFKSALESRRTTSSVVTSSNGIKLKIRFDAFEKKSQNSLDPPIGQEVQSASDPLVSENEHLNKDQLGTINVSEITSTSPAVTPAETVGNERVETAEEMFQRFQKQAMQEVFKAQSGVINLSRNLRPVRTSLAFLDKSLRQSNILQPKKKKKREEEKSSNLIPKTDDACSSTSAFSKDSGEKRLLEGNKKRHLSEGESVSVKQARLSIKDYPKLKEDSSITNQKKVICSNILAGHQVFVKFNTYSNIHTGRCFLVPFFNIGGTRTQFDVEDMEYISKAVMDYEKEEKSCARHLLFHAREGNKASFLRKDNYHHSSQITEKNYKKCSFLLEGFQRHAVKPSAPVVERWTVEKALDIEIDKADVDPNEEAYFASMIDVPKSDAVTGFELVTTEEAISKSQENNNSGLEIDIAEVDDNGEEEFASQMACSATQNIDNDGMTHCQAEHQSEISESSGGFSKLSHPHSPKTNRLEILNTGNGFSRSSHPLILKRNKAVTHSVLKDTVSRTCQVLPYSHSESRSSSTHEKEITRAVLSPNTVSQSPSEGIRSVVEEANSPCAPSQNSAVIKREVPNPDYGDVSNPDNGDVSTCDPVPSSPVSVLVPCGHRVKDEPIDEYFDTLSTLVIKRQDPSGMPLTGDVVDSMGPANLLEPQPLTNQLLSCPTLTRSSAAVSPDLPPISSQSDNNVKDKSSTDISDKPSTETMKCTRNNGPVVDDSVSSLNNRCGSVLSFRNTESVLVLDGVGGGQHEGMTTPTKKITSETESPVATGSTLTADESPPPSPSISESSEVSSYSDSEEPVVDELGQMNALSHGLCLSPDKQNPIQSKITSLVESLRQRLTQETPSLPSWLGTDTVPRVKSKIKIRSKDKSKNSTLGSTKNIERLSIESSTVACDESTKLPHSSSSPIIDNIHNPGGQSVFVDSSPPVSTLLHQSGLLLNESFDPKSSSHPQDPETLSPNAATSATRPGSVNKSNEDVLTEPAITPGQTRTQDVLTEPAITPGQTRTQDVLTEPAITPGQTRTQDVLTEPVITPGQTRTQSHCESPPGHECLPSVEIESFSKVQPFTSLFVPSPCDAQNVKLTFPQSSTFSVVHPTQASSNYDLPKGLWYVPQASSSNIPILSHGNNKTVDINCMNNAQQSSLSCPPVPNLTIDSNRSTPSDFEIDVGAEIFEDDVKFQPIQPKLRKLSWKDYAAPYSRLISTNIRDSPPMSPWGLLTEGVSTSAMLHPSQPKSFSEQPHLTHQRSKIIRQNYSKRGKKVKSFMRGKKSAEKKAVLPAIPSALDDFIPTETAESVTSYLTKKFSSTPGSKIKGPRLLHDPSKKKATPQKSESDTNLASAAQILPGPISTAELSKTPSLSEIFGIEIKKNVSSENLATDSESQVEVRGSSSEDFLLVAKRKTTQVAKKRTSQMARKKTSQVSKKKTSLVMKEERSQVARKRTSGKKKKLNAGNTLNGKRVSRVVDTVLKTCNGTIESTAPETVFKLLSPDSPVTSANSELRQKAPCDIKNELIPSLDDTKLSGGHVSIANTALSNIPMCTVALNRLEDMKHSYELRDGIYYVKGTKSKIIRDNKVKESSDIASASQKVARKIIKRKKKRSRVTKKQPVVRQKKDIVDYYTSMIESLQKKAQQLEEESKKEKERKELEIKNKKECAEKANEELGKTDGGNTNDNSGIEAALSEIYDHNVNEDMEEDELKNLLEPTDAGHLLNEKTSAASEPSKDSCFKSTGLGQMIGSEQVQDLYSGKSDLTSQDLVKHNSDNNEENLSDPANKKTFLGPEAGEIVGHEDMTDSEHLETNVEEGFKDFICGKDPLGKGTVFEKKDIVLCSSYDEELLKMSSCERQKMAAEEDALLGQTEDFEGDDIGVIPQIEVERLLWLDTNAASPDTLDDFNLELKDQISIMEQLKDGDLTENEMADVLQKQTGLKNEGRFLFGDSPGVKKSLTSEAKKDNSKTSDPSQSFESALRWVNIPEPSENTSPQDTVSLVASQTVDAQVKQSEAQHNFKVHLKFQTASLIKSIKLSKEMKNVFGEAASGGNSPNEDNKETFEKVLSLSEYAETSPGNNCTVATSAPEMPLTKSPQSKLPIPKLRVKLRKEAIEAIGKAKANFVSNKRAERKVANVSEGNLFRNSDNSEVQLQEDMQFYLRSSNSRVTPPRSPVKCQGQLSHSNQKFKRGFSPRRASPRFDLRATRSKYLSPNNSPLKVAELEVLKEHSHLESKQSTSTSKISEGIFSTVHLFDESTKCSASSDTNTGSKLSQSVNASDTAKLSQPVKPSVKPLTIDILKLKMKLNPLFSINIKEKQNSTKTSEAESKSPPEGSKETVSVCPESQPSITTSLLESSTNQRDVVHSAGLSRLEVVPSQAAFSNTSPQVVIKKLPTLNTAKLCNILKSFQKKTNNKTIQETCRPDSESTALSNTKAVLCSSNVTKRSSTRSTRIKKSAVGASRVGRALRSSAKNVQVSSTNLVGVESKNVVETIKQSDPTGNLLANPTKQLKEADDKERSFFDCLTDVTNPGDWVDM